MPTLLTLRGDGCDIFTNDGLLYSRRLLSGKSQLFTVQIPDNIKDAKIKGAEIVKIEKVPYITGVKLPAPEKEVTPIERDYKVVHIRDHHSPASINTRKGLIKINDQFLSANSADKKSIWFHELGHNMYNTEKYCDLYSAKRMLDLGWGVSVALLCLRRQLKDSPAKRERYAFVFNKLKDLKNARQNYR